jgi:hypothetical protein
VLQYLCIIPVFFSLYYVLKGRADLAFLNVYLPCTFLLPVYYAARLPHLPPESASSWALLPLGLSLLVVSGAPRLRRMDLWLFLFIVSFFMSEYYCETNQKDGLNLFLSNAFQMVLAYIVGRRLIEPDLRIATTRRIVLLLLWLTPAILYEYRMAQNPWIDFGSRLNLSVGSYVQLRGGHARVQACFGHPILAGILFGTAILFSCYLTDIYRRDKLGLGSLFSRLERYHVPILLLSLFLLLTQSRGPMMSTALGYSIVQVPKFRHFKFAAAVLALFFIIGGAIVYDYFEKYTNVPDTGQLSEEQESALYRREMLDNYKVVADQGGWLGWGVLSFPKVAGQNSIDNSYLLIRLSQGRLGLYLFVLLAVEGIATTMYKAFTFQTREDRFFAFTLLAALVSLFASLYTVYLGTQLIPVSFLLLGWSQSLGNQRREKQIFRFKRVFS